MDYQNYDFDEEIIKIVRNLQRNYNAVFPWMVTLWLELGRAEGSVRRDMARLARQGRLIRVGGYNARRGYRVGLIKKIVFPEWGKQNAKVA